MLAEQGKISDLVKEQLQPSRKRPPPAPSTPRGPTKYVVGIWYHVRHSPADLPAILDDF